jgi:hypothetical protein
VEAKKLATAAIHVATAAIHVATTVERPVPFGRTPRECKFAEALNCTGLHPSWRCGAFEDKKPEERARFVKDSKLCPYCLLHNESEVCYSKVNKTKPACEDPGCGGQHILWLPGLLKDTVKVEGKVNVVQGKEGWRTPDEAWIQDEREEEEEIHFVNVIQVDGADSDEELAGGDRQDRGSCGQLLPKKGQESRAGSWGPGGQALERRRERCLKREAR